MTAHIAVINYLTKLTSQVIDRLTNIGPMTSITIGEVPCLATGQTDPSDEALTAAQGEMAHIELIAAIARPPTKPHVGGSSITMLHRSVRARGLTAFELPEYNSLWSLYGPPVGTFGDKATETSPMIVEETKITPAGNASVPVVVVDSEVNGVKHGEENAEPNIRSGKLNATQFIVAHF